MAITYLAGAGAFEGYLTNAFGFMGLGLVWRGFRAPGQQVEDENTGFIKMNGKYIDPATCAERGAVYGLKKRGEAVLPNGYNKRVYPSQLAVELAAKQASEAKVKALYSSFL